jgi:hypothetical protein
VFVKKTVGVQVGGRVSVGRGVLVGVGVLVGGGSSAPQAARNALKSKPRSR